MSRNPAPLPIAALVAICAAIALPALPALGQSARDAGAAMSIGELKRAYLDCERRALVERLDTGTIMYCSVLYEDLKERAFGGSFRALRSWFVLQTGPGREFGA